MTKTTKLVPAARRAARWLAVLALLTEPACAQDRAGPASDAPQMAAAAAPAPSAPAMRLPNLKPHGGPPGTKVTVSMDDLLLGDSVQVGFGSFVEHQILLYGKVDSNGAYSGEVKVPDDSTPGPYYFFIANAQGTPVAVSDPFLVTRKDGTARLRGQMGPDAGGCKAMKGVNDELYTLTGKVGSPPAGAKVTVEGVFTETSTCKQGLTIQVTALSVDP